MADGLSMECPVRQCKDRRREPSDLRTKRKGKPYSEQAGWIQLFSRSTAIDNWRLSFSISAGDMRKVCALGVFKMHWELSRCPAGKCWS